MKGSKLQGMAANRWRLGIAAAIAMTMLALLPQFLLNIQRGRNWQGTYVSFDFDEVAYASYLNALIEGRPRRNDPYTGRDDTSEQPRAESLHSIQFLPAYAIALPARALGLSAGTAFIIIRGLAAFASTLALFWLLLLLTTDHRVAAAGAIIVLCLGGLAGEPLDAWRIITWRGEGEPFPFLRRYVPALVFPLFLVFIGLIWHALLSQSSKLRYRHAFAAGLVLGILIFSYFFLWTTAVAWLFILAALWLTLKPGSRGEAMIVFAIVAGCAALVLVPYGYLLTHRAATVDEAQLLTKLRMPIISFPVVVGLVVFISLVVASRFWPLNWRSPLVIFTASLALLPAVTFNQQLFSGLLLQPVHYGRYSSNYACVLAAFIVITVIWRPANRITSPSHIRALMLISALVFGWAIIESEVRSARFNEHFRDRDEALRVAWRLRDLETEHTKDGPAVVFCSDVLLSDNLPSVAPQPVLWATHLFVFSGSSAEENRQRLYQQLYFSGIDKDEFRAWAGSATFLQLSLFGWERMNQESHVRPITAEEVQRETTLYEEYIRNFDRNKAMNPLLGYAVVASADNESLANLDRWYERDAGETVGNYRLYKTRLK